MAKTNHVIISYFANKDQAATAGDEIKEWDKANDAIKLGGVGVLTWKDGKVKTHKISRVHARRGAKWGTVLGATAGDPLGRRDAGGRRGGGRGGRCSGCQAVPPEPRAERRRQGASREESRQRSGCAGGDGGRG